MKRRLLVPVDDPNGTKVAGHFGRAPYFAIIDIDGGQVVSKVVEPNRSEHTGGRGHAHDNVFAFNPHVVIVYAMGPRGLSSFQMANVAVLRANSQYLDEVVASYLRGELEELTQGCLEAHYS